MHIYIQIYQDPSCQGFFPLRFPLTTAALESTHQWDGTSAQHLQITVSCHCAPRGSGEGVDPPPPTCFYSHHARWNHHHFMPLQMPPAFQFSFSVQWHY